MRPCRSPRAPAAVIADTTAVLSQTLKRQTDTQAVTAGRLLDLLLVMAAAARARFDGARARFDGSAELASRAGHSALPDAAAPADRLADALHAGAAFGRLDRRRRWTVAIDSHVVPFDGDGGSPSARGRSRRPSRARPAGSCPTRSGPAG